MNDGQIKYKVVVDSASAEKSIGSLNKKSADLQKTFKSAGKGLTLGLTLPIAGFLAVGVNYNKRMETMSTSFETMTGSAEKAGKVMTRIKDIARKTPFGSEDLAKTTQLLMQYGFEAEEALDSMQMLGDISQGSAEKMQRVATAYGQMSSAGKVNLEDVKQMIEAGFNPLLEISERTGESMGSLYDRISKGTMSVDEISGAMKSATSEGGKFFGSMEAQSKTMSGKLSTMTDDFNAAAGELTTNLLPVITNIVDGLSKIFNWFSSLSPETQTFILTLMGILAAVGPILSLVGAVMGLGVAFGVAFFPIMMIVAAVVAVIAVIAMVIIYFKQIKAFLGDMWVYWSKVFGNMWLKIVEIFTKIKNFIGGVFKSIGNFFISMINGILTNLNKMIKLFLLPLNTLIKGLNLIPGVNIPTLKLAIPKIPALATGTNNVQREGLAYLHQGEAVVPKKYNPAMGGSQAIVIEMGDVIMDGKSVGRMTAPYITKTIKVGGGNV